MPRNPAERLQAIDALLSSIPPEWQPSSEAREVLTAMYDDIDRPGGRAVEHAVRSVRNLALFCKAVSPEKRCDMADAMLLHDVPGRILHRETEERAYYSDSLQAAWRAFAESRSNDAYNYMHDQVTIGTCARRYREQQKSIDKQINDSQYDGMVNVRGWQQDIATIRGDELAELAMQVNIESLIIKAAEMLDNLKYPPTNDSQQMRNILEAESFYIPMLKVLGYDAMGAEMASTCDIYRLYGQGQEGIVQQAMATYERYSQYDPGEVAQAVFGLEVAPEVRWIVNETSSDVKEGINCRFAEMEVPIGGKMRRVLFRQKSIGSSARKQSAKGDDYVLLDTFGFQVIAGGNGDSLDRRQPYEMADDEIDRVHDAQVKELAGCYGDFVRQVSANHQIALQATHAGKAPLFFQGDAAFNQAMRDGLAPDHRISERLDSRPTPYRVAKMTGMVHKGAPAELSVEVQLLTQVDRQLARTGPTSHLMYKNGGNHDGLRWIIALHRRIEYMKHGGGNPVSREMGRTALTALNRGLYAALFAPQTLYGARVR